MPKEETIRTTIGMLVAPVAGLLVGVLAANIAHPQGFGWLDGTISRPSAALIYITMMSPMAFGGMIIFGCPTSHWLTKNGITSLVPYGLLGALFGLLTPALIINVMVLLKQHTLTLRTALLPFGILQPISVGITTGLVFWLIAVRKRRAQQSGGVCVSPVTFGGSIRVSASTQVNSKSVVRAFVEAINAKDWARLRAVLAPEFRRHSVAAGEPGVRAAEDLIAFLVAEYATFPDAHETLLDLVAEGDKVAARHLFHGTQLGPMGQFPPSEKLLEATYLAIYRIENGRIVEAWVEWDNLAGLKQLGYSAV